jgi:hypothetical protein
LGITSVQRQNEEIIPMTDMKMGWIPFKSSKKEYLSSFFSTQVGGFK